MVKLEKEKLTLEKEALQKAKDVCKELEKEQPSQVLALQEEIKELRRRSCWTQLQIGT